jgi:type 1 fimbriae regulatory protein FimB/type 1 fimbriae regulatory protein FimE
MSRRAKHKRRSALASFVLPTVRRTVIIEIVIDAEKAKHMAKSHLKLVTPATVKRTVAAKRLPNDKLRTREHLTEVEVERLMTAAKRNRWGHRDATMVLVAYRHGLRVSELVDLRWTQVDFGTATLHVRRVKQGTPSTHPILGDELRALRRLQREQDPKSPFVFTSERGAPFSTAGFARMLERAGVEAKLGFKAHPHMLRHACGYALANKGALGFLHRGGLDRELLLGGAQLVAGPVQPFFQRLNRRCPQD